MSDNVSQNGLCTYFAAVNNCDIFRRPVVPAFGNVLWSLCKLPHGRQIRIG